MRPWNTNRGAAEQRAHLHRIEGPLVRVRQDDLILIGGDTAPGSRRRRFEINRVLRRPGDRSPFGKDTPGRGLIGEADLRLELRHIGDLAHSGKRIAQTVERTELEGIIHARRQLHKQIAGVAQRIVVVVGNVGRPARLARTPEIDDIMRGPLTAVHLPRIPLYLLLRLREGAAEAAETTPVETTAIVITLTTSTNARSMEIMARNFLIVWTSLQIIYTIVIFLLPLYPFCQNLSTIILEKLNYRIIFRILSHLSSFYCTGTTAKNTKSSSPVFIRLCACPFGQ